jgi:hypothetical protein
MGSTAVFFSVAAKDGGKLCRRRKEALCISMAASFCDPLELLDHFVTNSDSSALTWTPLSSDRGKKREDKA